MDNNFQSSFIPKNSSVNTGSMAQKEKLGFVGFLCVLLFVTSVLGLGGVFAYKKITENSISSLESDLATAESKVDKSSINTLVNFDKRLKSIKQIVTSHVAVSGYLKLLEGSTVSTLHFSNLKYDAPSSDGQLAIQMDGKTTSYAAVAEEESVLQKNPDTISISFENLALDPDSGGVSFTLKGTFKGDAVKWSSLIPKNPSIVPTGATASSTNKTNTSTSTEDASANLDLPDLPNF